MIIKCITNEKKRALPEKCSEFNTDNNNSFWTIRYIKSNIEYSVIRNNL